jgi:hypothetical protein
MLLEDRPPAPIMAHAGNLLLPAIGCRTPAAEERMRLMHLVVSCPLLVCCVGAAAADAADKRSTLSMFGITIGAPLDMARCPRSPAFGEGRLGSATCVTRARPADEGWTMAAVFLQDADLSSFIRRDDGKGEAIVVLHDGIVDGVTINVRTSEAGAAAAHLKARFGEPADCAPSAKINAIVCNWTVDSHLLSFVQRRDGMGNQVFARSRQLDAALNKTP